MPSGGKRTPAGGRPATKLDDMARLHIGAMCENHWQKLAERIGKTRFLEENPSYKLVHMDQDNMNAIPVAERKKSALIQEFQTDIENDLGGNPRSYTFRYIRPHGKKGVLLMAAARWATRQYEIKISPRMVKTLWDEYRLFLKENS